MCVCVLQKHVLYACIFFLSLACTSDLIFQQGSKRQHISSTGDLFLKSDAIIKINKASVQTPQLVLLLSWDCFILSTHKGLSLSLKRWGRWKWLKTFRHPFVCCLFFRLPWVKSASPFYPGEVVCKNVCYIFINALLHINTAPHTPSWQLPNTTTVSYCWLPDDPSGANEGYIPCPKAEGRLLVNHVVRADIPSVLLHFLTCKKPRPLHPTLTSCWPCSSCNSWWKHALLILSVFFREWGREVLLARSAKTVN